MNLKNTPSEGIQTQNIIQCTIQFIPNFQKMQRSVFAWDQGREKELTKRDRIEIGEWQKVSKLGMW